MRLVGASSLALVTSLALAGCAGSAGDPASSEVSEDLTTIRVSLGWIKNVEWAGFWIADANGYYAEEGLDIEWIGGGPNAPTTMATVAAGDADLGIVPSTQQWLQTFADGNDWTALGALFQESPGALVSLAEDPVYSAEDLVGKTVLGQEGTQINYDAAFALAGLEPDYDFIPVGFDIAPFVVFPLFCADGAGLSVGRVSCWTRSVWGGRHPTRCGWMSGDHDRCFSTLVPEAF